MIHFLYKILKANTTCPNLYLPPAFRFMNETVCLGLGLCI